MKKLINLISLFLCMAMGTVSFAQEATNQQDIQKAVSYCSPWFKEKSFEVGSSGVDIPMKMHIPIDNIICVDGHFSTEKSRLIIPEVKKISGKSNPILIIRSRGGDINPALDLAEVIQKSNFTVVAYDICASSCANYVFLAAKSRFVLPETLLLFHGGASMDLLASIADQMKLYFKDDQSGYEREVERARVNLLQQINRQEEFLKNSNISKHFFYWMGMLSHMSDEEQKEICSNDPSMVLYDQNVLASMKIHIAGYSGPKSKAELDTVKSKKKINFNICYWNKI